MTLLNYLAERRKEVEERIAAETLAGNEVKLNCEKSALAELAGVEKFIAGERYYKISTDDVNTNFEAHGMRVSTALINILQHLTLETVNANKKRRGKK